MKDQTVRKYSCSGNSQENIYLVGKHMVLAEWECHYFLESVKKKSQICEHI